MQSDIQDAVARHAMAPFLDGVLEQSVSDTTVEAMDPSTGRPMLSIPAGAEGGLAGLENYLRRQLVCINHA
jgi:hypothetical protein